MKHSHASTIRAVHTRTHSQYKHASQAKHTHSIAQCTHAYRHNAGANTIQWATNHTRNVSGGCRRKQKLKLSFFFSVGGQLSNNLPVVLCGHAVPGMTSRKTLGRATRARKPGSPWRLILLCWVALQSMLWDLGSSAGVSPAQHPDTVTSSNETKALPQHPPNVDPFAHPSSLLELKAKLSAVVQESDLIGIIALQAKQNDRAIQALEKKMRAETGILAAKTQELAQSVSEAQKRHGEQVVQHARTLQALFDSHDDKLRQMFRPTATWLVRAGDMPWQYLLQFRCTWDVAVRATCRYVLPCCSRSRMCPSWFFQFPYLLAGTTTIGLALYASKVYKRLLCLELVPV